MTNLNTEISEILPLLSPEVSFSYGYIYTLPKKLKWPWITPKKPSSVFLSSHFFFIIHEDALAYAVEVLIFFASDITVFYVTKADSTGFFNKNQAPSPFKPATSAFLSYLLKRFSKKDIPSRISLFARSQPQYIFPSSCSNPHKHILNDRELIRWWAKVLDCTKKSHQPKKYILIPGIDTRETLSFTPNYTNTSLKWICGHPYQSANKPAREIIPHFPDDPKTRLLDQLDIDGQGETINVDQFWELMAFRQECTLGRIVGFLNIEFPPSKDQENKKDSSLSKDLNEECGVQMSERIYRMHYEKLLRSDFETLEKTKGATLDWIHSINNIKSTNIVTNWMKTVSGSKTIENKKRINADVLEQSKTINILNKNLVRKKSKKNK
ncbi:unnamed protein product [Pneumocystis jirovecii]|uniref:histone acetyltransferase n=2 Tax=Pneumocystis jirovecii TaxID=42068 RepID=L0P8P2_PNEJI|nr:H3 histone acetyltransferase RTT109 [Pneumocystis jirovecii RU7]KTW32640.1 hypothetical protein T551_00125 [Pneumocystis jirovecii RU7]CCJ28444.1 unnamed protein product [Pneumocystis jirovecii]